MNFVYYWFLQTCFYSYLTILLVPILLQRSGAMFPRRADTTVPIFTPPQTHPIAASFPSPERSPNNVASRTNASRPSDLPGLRYKFVVNHSFLIPHVFPGHHDMVYTLGGG